MRGIFGCSREVCIPSRISSGIKVRLLEGPAVIAVGVGNPPAPLAKRGCKRRAQMHTLYLLPAFCISAIQHFSHSAIQQIQIMPLPEAEESPPRARRGHPDFFPVRSVRRDHST